MPVKSPRSKVDRGDAQALRAVAHSPANTADLTIEKGNHILFFRPGQWESSLEIGSLVRCNQFYIAAAGYRVFPGYCQAEARALPVAGAVERLEEALERLALDALAEVADGQADETALKTLVKG